MKQVDENQLIKSLKCMPHFYSINQYTKFWQLCWIHKLWIIDQKKKKSDFNYAFM